MNQSILCVIGPTGIGKSKKAISLAKELNGEIISADAYQVYKGFNIGTATPTLEEQERIPHHLINHKSPESQYSVVEFLEDCNNCIKKIIKKKKTVIICGGTALYINAFINNYTMHYPTDASIRKKLEEKAKNIEKEKLWLELHEKDPDHAKTIPYQNTRRIIRALEIIYLTKKPITSDKPHINTKRNDTNIIGLIAPREIIIKKIDQRVEKMIKEELIEEVKLLLKKGVPEDCPAFSAIGYKETLLYLKGTLSKSEMIEQIKIKTRQFSKRQMTWFRKFQNVSWININD
jgi:tRNA dimethylallyltransferase